ncbi:nuclear transport factor 2 family protein [Streptomyces inhibens]|uniref:nuclear transport factor 2 family protein n=1 Tax=Streptomyces inhibens TaxID=2293571 RepID=UPI0036BBB2BD
MSVLIAAAALCATTATTAYAAQDAGRRPPRIVDDWARAWNGTDPQALGALFTADGTYTDEAVGVTFHGRTEIAGWKARADSTISQVHVTVRAAHRNGGRITVEAIYSGHIKGAPKPFAVPMTVSQRRGVSGSTPADGRDHRPRKPERHRSVLVELAGRTTANQAAQWPFLFADREVVPPKGEQAGVHSLSCAVLHAADLA